MTYEDGTELHAGHHPTIHATIAAMDATLRVERQPSAALNS